jgi:HPt (histidine-containing phosphotransfer) domain-containing protein
MISIFSSEYPIMLDQLQQAIEHGDSSAVEKVSHKIKGSLVQFSALAAAETARRLEEMGKHNSMGDGATVLEHLKRELEELMQVLNAVVSDGFTE